MIFVWRHLAFQNAVAHLPVSTSLSHHHAPVGLRSERQQQPLKVSLFLVNNHHTPYAATFPLHLHQATFLPNHSPNNLKTIMLSHIRHLLPYIVPPPSTQLPRQPQPTTPHNLHHDPLRTSKQPPPPSPRSTSAKPARPSSSTNYRHLQSPPFHHAAATSTTLPYTWLNLYHLCGSLPLTIRHHRHHPPLPSLPTSNTPAFYEISPLDGASRASLLPSSSTPEPL